LRESDTLTPCPERTPSRSALAAVLSLNYLSSVSKLIALPILLLSLQARVIVDQSFAPPESEVRLDTQVGVAPFFAGAQTFTPAIDGELAGFDFWIQASGGEPLKADLRVQLQTTTDKGKPSGSSLAAVVLPPSFLDEQPGIYKHVELGGVPLRAGQLYAVVFQAVPFVSGGNAAYDFRGYSISQLGGPHYYGPGQGMFTEDGRSWRDYAGADFDFVFRSYMIVPEPATSTLILLGSVLMVSRLRLSSQRSPRGEGLARVAGVAERSTLTRVLDMHTVNWMVGARVVEHMISQPKASSSPRFLPAEISAAARMERFAALQKKAFALLAASPEGRRRFWQRNLRKRCIHGSF
jgi:hypothetical protein